MNQASIITTTVWALFFGIVFSIIFITVQKNALNKFIFGLINNSATCPEKSKKLIELGIQSKLQRKIIYSGIKSQHGLIKIIGFALKDKLKKPGEFSRLIPDDNYSFYYDENFSNEATKKYDIKKSNKLHLTICIILLLVIACVASTVISWLSSYAGNVFDGYSTYVPPKEQQNDEVLGEDETKPSEDEQNNDTLPSDEPNTEQDNDENSTENDSDIESEPENQGAEQITGPSIPKGPLG